MNANNNNPYEETVVDNGTISAVYEGETKNGLKHGYGTLTWDDGESYEGMFENDKKTHGTFRWKSGDTYTGQWKDNLMHGMGVYNYVDGRKYEGNWVAGYRDGFGVFTWVNGDRYEGNFSKDQCHGYGVQTYVDGRVYRGEWEHNKKHGHGLLTWPNGDQIEGTWENNLLTGIAIFTESDGRRYYETWKDGVRVGDRRTLKRTAAEIQTLLAATEPPVWAKDGQFIACYKCDEPFTFTNRRHHCRHCGLIYCERCWTHKMPLPRVGMPAPQKVCDECFIVLNTQRILAQRNQGSKEDIAAPQG